MAAWDTSVNGHHKSTKTAAAPALAAPKAAPSQALDVVEVPRLRHIATASGNAASALVKPKQRQPTFAAGAAYWAEKAVSPQRYTV